jgi:hypothetical protein
LLQLMAAVMTMSRKVLTRLKVVLMPGAPAASQLRI